MEARDKVRIGLLWKILFVTGLSMSLVAFILVLTFSLQMRASLNEELRKRGRAVGIELANNLAFAVFSKDKVGLNTAAKATLRDIPDVAYVVLRNSSGAPLGRALTSDLPGLSMEALPKVGTTGDDKAQERSFSVGEAELLEVEAPIFFEERAKPAEGSSGVDLFGIPTADAPQAETQQGKQLRIGTVQVGFRLDPLRSQVLRASLRALGVGFFAFLVGLAAAALLARMLTVPLARLSKAAAGIAQGNLQQHIDPRGNDEIATLARSFETMADGLRAMLSDLRSAGVEIEREVERMLGTATHQSALTVRQASAQNQASTSMQEIGQTSIQSTERADSVIRVTQRAEEYSREGQKVVVEAVSGIEVLDQKVRIITSAIGALTRQTTQIGEIISTVRDLADQSNMLAINASLEATRAGDHGKGFGVVAKEIRSLAQQSKRAAERVKNILNEVSAAASAAAAASEEGGKQALKTVSLAKKAGNTIVGLSGVCEESSLGARSIATSSRQQMIGVKQIVEALNGLSSVTEETVTGTQEIERAAASLKVVSARFTDLVAHYRT